MERVQGPMNLSTNEELCSPGLQLDGFDKPPMVMMTHTRPYYPALVEAAGYGKAKDLLAYYLADGTPPKRLVDGVGRLQRAEDADRRLPLMREMALIWEVELKNRASARELWTEVHALAPQDEEAGRALERLSTG